MQNWQIFQACFSCFAVVSQALIIKARKTFVILHSALSDTFSGISVEKTIREKEIVKITWVRMSLACLFLLGKCDCRFGRQLSKISIWLVKKAFTINYSLIFWVRQKCGWKGNCFDRRLKTLKCGWHPPDAGELALLLISVDQFLLRPEIIFEVLMMVQS